MDPWTELAQRLGLKEETIKDLASSGWSYTSEYRGSDAFVAPFNSLTVKHNIFEEKTDD